MKSPIRKLVELLPTGDKDFSEVLFHTGWAFIMLAMATGIQFLFDLILARTYGAEGSGVFYLALSVLTMVSLVARLGIDRSIIRFMPRFFLTEDASGALGFKQTVDKLVLSTSIILALIIFISSEFIAQSILEKPEIGNYIRIFALAIPGYSFLLISSSFLRSKKLVKESLIIEKVMPYFLGIFFIVISTLLLNFSLVFWGFFLSIYICTSLAILLFRKKSYRDVVAKRFSVKKLLSASLPLLFVIFALQTNGSVSTIILGKFASTEDVGIYNIVIKISMLISVVLAGINSINATKISEYDEGHKDLGSLLGKTSALSLVLGLPMFLLIIFFPEFLLSLFGNEFTTGAQSLIILAFAQLINISVGSVNFTLTVTGREKSLAIIAGISSLINLILSVILVPNYGVLGAIIALSVAMSFTNIASLVLVKRYLGVWSLPFKTLLKWSRLSK